MYKILIADDEPRHRRGIIDLVRKFRPGYLLFEAADGQDAWDIIHAHDIDIVITDIRMPKLDGLQLIERLGHNANRMKVVFLSAYEYFEYARKAVALGAFQYEIKPLEEGAIEKLLLKLESSIQKDKQIFIEKESMVKNLNDTMPIFLDHLFTKWVEGRLTADEWAHIRKKIPDGCRYLVIASEIVDSEAGDSAPGEGLAEAYANLRAGIGDFLKPWGDSESFLLGEKRKTLITVLYAKSAAGLDAGNVFESVDRLVEDGKRRCGWTLVSGISRAFERVDEEINRHYRQAVEALNFHFFYGPEAGRAYEKIAFGDSNLSFSLFMNDDRLSEAIKQLNRERALSIVENLFKRIVAEGFHSPQRVKEFIVFFLLHQIKNLENILLKPQFVRLFAKAESLTADRIRFDRLQEVAKAIIGQMMAAIEERNNNKNSEIIKKCKAYIENNYMNDIALEDLAKQFYFSPAYFSSFFKNETGMSFSEFLLQTRMNKAKQLLLRSNDKVYRIANQTGYHDPGYFTKVFKREFGISPEEYRKNNGINRGSMS